MAGLGEIGRRFLEDLEKSQTRSRPRKPLDPSKVCEQSMSAETVSKLTKGCWGFFAKAAGTWKTYFLDQSGGIIESEAEAREMYEIAKKDKRVEAAWIIQIKSVEGFSR